MIDSGLLNWELSGITIKRERFVGILEIIFYRLGLFVVLGKLNTVLGYIIVFVDFPQE